MTRDESITTTHAASITPAATTEPNAATPAVRAEKEAPVAVHEQAYHATETAGTQARPNLPTKMAVKDLKFFYGDHLALKSINLPVYANKVTALIGPSGCGKSTLLRVMNRMYDLYPRQRAEGAVMLDNENILDKGTDLNLLRSRVGMVFQKPTPFPMSIFDNIAFGIKLYNRLPQKPRSPSASRTALRGAALWNEVKDKLNDSGLSLSGGQQQRLCIARTVAVQPGGDPVRRALLGARPDLHRQGRGADGRALRQIHARDRHPFNMQQAARVSHYTAFMYLGELVEYGDTKRMFTSPEKQQTQDYITGRFG